MGIKTWFVNTFPIFNRDKGNLDISECFGELNIEVYYKKMAIETAINLIANTLSLAEFKTFEKGKEVKRENYYLFNIEPNRNENANEFWRKAIHKMVYENEVLIVMQDNSLIIADYFQRKEYAIKENYYSNVKVGDFTFDKIFYESEVFYLQLHSEKMKNLIDGLYQDYGKLIEYSKNTYKRSNARRGTLDIPVNYPATDEAKKRLENLLNKQFKNFFNAENGAVLPLTNGVTYNDLTNQTYKNGSDSRDIRMLIDDIFDYVAVAFQISPQLLKGSVADSDKSFDNLMAFCIRPWAELIEKEINRKMYGKMKFVDKTFLKVDTTMIKFVSIKDLAGAIDLLTRNGVNTIDDNLKLLGKEEIGGEVGRLRLITLNLETIENFMKGGRKDGQTKN